MNGVSNWVTRPAYSGFADFPAWFARIRWCRRSIFAELTDQDM